MNKYNEELIIVAKIKQMNYLSTMSDIPEFATTALESEQFYIPRPLMDHCLPEFGANGVTAYACC